MDVDMLLQLELL